MAGFLQGWLDEREEEELCASECVAQHAQTQSTSQQPNGSIAGGKSSVGGEPTTSKSAMSKCLWPGAHRSPEKKRGIDKVKRAARGSAGTFAGRRPPKNPTKLAFYNQLKQDYEKTMKEIKSTPKNGKKTKPATMSQESFWQHMRSAMKKDAGSPQERFAKGAKEFRAKMGLH